MNGEPYVYKCDPSKHTECKKRGCQRDCFLTLYKEYSLDGKQYRWQEGELIEKGDIKDEI